MQTFRQLWSESDDMKRSTWLHLRVPFSFFLLPVFLFALVITPGAHPVYTWSMFIILHFFLYPASNGYNSFFDKDQQSIGGLEKPPPVTKELYYISILLDILAIIWGWLIDWKVAVMLFIYGLVSKAYSHPAIRLKKYPILGWLAAGIFQGAFTFMMVYMAVHSLELKDLLKAAAIIPACLSTLLLWGSYPMTQVYQHEEDASRGDMTISRLLGIKGTFIFTALVFLTANVGFIYYFLSYQNQLLALGFQMALLPILLYFIWWMRKVWKDLSKADFHHTMRLNFISGLCLNAFFLTWWVLS